MKNKILILIFLIPLKYSYAQLKAENFLFIDSVKKIKTDMGIDIKGFTIHSSGFKYDDNLYFSYYRKHIVNYCCNYYEVKQIPKEWNIITVKDIIAHLEDKSTGFRFNTKKLFFVEYDKDRRIYKAYQVDIIGWPRTD